MKNGFECDEIRIEQSVYHSHTDGAFIFELIVPLALARFQALRGVACGGEFEN